MSLPIFPLSSSPIWAELDLAWNLYSFLDVTDNSAGSQWIGQNISKLGVSLCSIANICIFWNLDLSNLLGRGVTPKQLFHTNSESPMNCTMSPPNEVLTFGLDDFHSHPFYIFMAYPSPCTFFTFRTLMSRLCCHATDRLLQTGIGSNSLRVLFPAPNSSPATVNMKMTKVIFTWPFTQLFRTVPGCRLCQFSLSHELECRNTQ